MATTVTVNIPVHIYGSHVCAVVLRLLARLVALLGVRLTLWLANGALHWLLWARIGNHWYRPMQDGTIEVCRGAATEEVA